jgi:hypothetical protein
MNPPSASEPASLSPDSRGADFLEFAANLVTNAFRLELDAQRRASILTHDVLKHDTAKALLCWDVHGRTIAFQPVEDEYAVFLNPPRYFDATVTGGQRAVFRSVGGKLVHGKVKILGRDRV